MPYPNPQLTLSSNQTSSIPAVRMDMSATI
jgi:hypothetical protein